jgi:membrane-associated phospholipid phosphatase
MSIWNDLSWVEGIRTPFFNFFFYNVSLTGYPIFLFLFIAFGYFFWSPQRFSRVAMLLFISAVINSFLKDLFQDPRPPADLMLDGGTGTSYGWPSGHAQIAVTLWGLLAYELKNKFISVGAITFILLVAFSRMYLGVHDLGDVIAGLLIGSFILLLWHYAVVYKLYEKFDKLSWFFILIAFQSFVHLLYPSHEEHEISNWLLGAMTGWFLGASNLVLASNILIKLLLSLTSTVAVFFIMIFLFQLEGLVELSGLTSILYSYSLGIFFSIFVSWVIPRFWKLFNLAS